jgi:type IV secretory pathway TrbF-like protein
MYLRANVALCGVVLVLAGLLVHTRHNTKVLAYVVEVAETGQVRSVGILPHVWKGDNPAVVHFFVREWLGWVRNLPTDSVVIHRQWEKAKDTMTKAAWQRVQPYLQTQSERHARKEVVQIEFGTITAIAGHAQSYDVEWRETSYGQDGSQLSAAPWKASVKVVIYPPTALKDGAEFRNPLGMFVDDVQWNERARW